MIATAMCDERWADAVPVSAPLEELPRGVMLRDRSNRLLLRFDPISQSAVICFPDSELSLRSVAGVIEISSANAIRIRSGAGIELVAAGPNEIRETRLAVTPSAVNLHAEALHAVVTETNFVGGSVNARADRVRTVWGTCERVVGRAFDYARQAYQRVEVLLHVRAGRIRTESEGTFLIQSRAARIQADDDVRVQAKAINLG